MLTQAIRQRAQANRREEINGVSSASHIIFREHPFVPLRMNGIIRFKA